MIMVVPQCTQSSAIRYWSSFERWRRCCKSSWLQPWHRKQVVVLLLTQVLLKQLLLRRLQLETPLLLPLLKLVLLLVVR